MYPKQVVESSELFERLGLRAEPSAELPEVVFHVCASSSAGESSSSHLSVKVCLI